jgi:hypothetical protein
VTPTDIDGEAVGGRLQGLSIRDSFQVDVSLRLSLSEPLVFSSSVPGRRAAEARLTGLRAFSASGRQPAVRVDYQASRAQSLADGWFAAATLPLTGELTIPFTDAASFKFATGEASDPRGISTIRSDVGWWSCVHR